MIRCYRRVCQFASEGWFWLWTTTLIYANKLREIVNGTMGDELPSVPVSSSETGDVTYLIGDFAKEYVVASTIVLTDGSEVDFNDEHLQEYTDTPVTAGEILSKHSIEYSPGIKLSVILADGKTLVYEWDDSLILS